jgi:cupin 2 domain-containing protein
MNRKLPKVMQLFPDSDIPTTGERFEELLTRRNVRIERIVSAPGSVSGPYDQIQNEWVLLLQGRALLDVDGERLELQAGEALFLPAHCLHRVLDTSAEPPCIWLAVHID